MDESTGKPWSYASRTAYLARRNRFRSLTAWALLLLAAAAIGVRWSSLAWQPLVVFAAFAPYLGMGAFISAFLFWLGRAGIRTACACALAVAVVAVQVPSFVGGDAAPPPAAITVLQANLDLGLADMATLVHTVEKHDVQVLAVEELTPSAVAGAESAGLDAVLPYRVLRPAGGGGGVGLWSRYPLAGVESPPGFTLKVVTASVVLPGLGRIAVLAAHILPPWPTSSTQWAGELAHFRTVLVAAADRGPVLAMGDFNATTAQRQFRSLTSGFRDAANAVGAGWLPTYPADKPWPPLLAIDHVILHDLRPVAVESVSLLGSDHRGVLAAVSP